MTTQATVVSAGSGHINSDSDDHSILRGLTPSMRMDHLDEAHAFESELTSFQTVTTRSLAECLFRRQLNCCAFQMGVERGVWRLVEINWPDTLIAIGKITCYTAPETCIRFCLEHYPFEPPIIALWDLTTSKQLQAAQWPSWFIDFIAESFPQLVALDPEPYTPELLTLSILIARRGKHAPRRLWNSSQDITQCLNGLLECFFSSSASERTDNYPSTNERKR